ncbi:MAG: L-asparaginase 1, partial [Flavobacteriales bacterium]|nr:L-asparaginase 1 [Flavobacteriales bacterium]
FRSPNWPVLAEAGVHLRYDRAAILLQRKGPLILHEEMNDHVGVIRLFPGIRAEWVRHALATPHLRAAVLTTFGSGNGPTDAAFISALHNARDKGIELLNVTQCVGGRVEQGRYITSRAFNELGVVPAADMTIEAAVTKTMFLLGQGLSGEAFAKAFGTPICGEMTVA